MKGWWWRIELEGIGRGGLAEGCMCKCAHAHPQKICLCIFVCVCVCVEVCVKVWTSCSAEVCVSRVRRPPDLGLVPGVRRLSIQTAWRGSAGPGSTPKPIPEDRQHTRAYTSTKITHMHTAGKPITAAHYWAGQVQVLTQATINPWIPSGLLDVHSERLTRLNVRAVASVMRQDNCAVFQAEQVSSPWPWG